MPYVDCPHCHASFHTGLIYHELELCPRCETPLFRPRPTVRTQVRGLVTRRARVTADAPDWEAITGSQYVLRHRVTGAQATEGRGSRLPV